MNDKQIIISDKNENRYPSEFKNITEEKVYSTLIAMISGNELANSVLFTPHPEEIMKMLVSRLHYIEAGGGLLSNDQGQLLFIFRHGKWDLPKGKLEKGESPEAGSIREVEEECNIRVRELGKPLQPSWHAYQMDGKPVLKKTWWFRMMAGDDQQMRPQTEEGITQLRWFDPGELDPVRENTYALIREVAGL